MQSCGKQGPIICVALLAVNLHKHSPTTKRFLVTVVGPALLLASHVYTPLLPLTTGLMVRTDPLTPSVTTTLSFRNV